MMLNRRRRCQAQHNSQQTHSKRPVAYPGKTGLIIHVSQSGLAGTEDDDAV